MAYCGQATQSNANYLASKTGLDPAVALAWLRNECQSTANPTNPLNIRYYGSAGQVGHVGGFATYASTHAGLDAAANLINNSAHYTGIRAAIKSKSPYAEAHAIELSPWAAGHYGGSSTKYGNIVSTVKKVLGGTLPALPAGSTTLPKGTNVGGIFVDSPDAAQKQLIKIFGELGITDPNHVITPTEGLAIAAKLGKTGDTEYGGQTPAQLLGSLGLTGVPNLDIAGAIGGLGDMIGKLAGFGAGLVLIALGVFLYSKSIRSRVETTAGTVAAVA